MVNDLDLKGNDLIAYAIIYGFTQDGQNEYTGSINYLAKWLNCSRPTVIKALKYLTERCLITKTPVEVNGVTFNKYATTIINVKEDLGGSKETLPLVKKLDLGSKETLPGGSKETLPNNNLINNKVNTNDDVHQNIDTLFNAYLENTRLVEAVIKGKRFSSEAELKVRLRLFNKHLEENGQFSKTWKDYTSHFLNWSKKNKAINSKSPTDITL